MTMSCLCSLGITFTFIVYVVSGNSDISGIFGSNVNKEEAWAKLLEIQGCPKPEVWSSNIIMVNESLSAGAQFIGNPNATSRYECEFECCYKREKGCNIAVYTADMKHCYLFGCGQPSKCKFDQHSGYTVSSISPKLSLNGATSTSVPAKPTTKLVATTPSPPKQLHLLDGCRPAIDTCATDHTECSSTGFCTCTHGYHPKNGVCRQDCLEGLQFECTNGDSKYGSPDCVAVYDVCDGTPQCPDGSDEKDCDKDKLDWSKLGDMESIKSIVEEYMKQHEKNKTTTVKAVPVAPAKPSVPTADIVALLTGTSKHSDNHEQQLVGLSTVISKLITTNANSTTTSQPLVTEISNSSYALNNNNQAVVREQDGVINTSSRSAVIALSLSLAITLALVVYLGCRYKNMKRRVTRPGKALNGSEVDYLIDGMYL